MACCVDWKQHGEGAAASDESHSRSYFEIPQEEKGIERVVVENIAVGDFIKDTEPIEQSFGQLRRAFPVEKSWSAVNSRLVDIDLELTVDEENPGKTWESNCAGILGAR